MRRALTSALIGGAAASGGGTIKLNWSDCGDSSTHGHITSLSPTSVTLGTKTTISGKGKVDEAIPGATFKVVAKEGFIPIFSHTGDACKPDTIKLPAGAGEIDMKGFKCPLSPGAAELDLDLSLSSSIPAKLARITIELTAQTSSGDKALCVQIKTSPENLIADGDNLIPDPVQDSSSDKSLPLIVTEEESAAQQAQWQRIHDALNGTAQVPATCAKDMRSKMPACHQFGQMWCWATGVAELTEYYKGSGPAQCNGLECQVVSWCPKPPHCASHSPAQCCPLSQHEECGVDGASLPMVVEAANHFTGRQHQLTKGPMSQATLDKTLASGGPILMLVGKTAPFHVVTVAGCGQGNYYFHDPEWPAGVYKEYSFQELLESPTHAYKWLDTVAPLGEETDVVV